MLKLLVIATCVLLAMGGYVFAQGFDSPYNKDSSWQGEHDTVNPGEPAPGASPSWASNPDRSYGAQAQPNPKRTFKPMDAKEFSERNSKGSTKSKPADPNAFNK